MKLTRRQLRQIIKEELFRYKTLIERGGIDLPPVSKEDLEKINNSEIGDDYPVESEYGESEDARDKRIEDTGSLARARRWKPACGGYMSPMWAEDHFGATVFSFFFAHYPKLGSLALETFFGLSDVTLKGLSLAASKSLIEKNLGRIAGWIGAPIAVAGDLASFLNKRL